MDNAKAEIKALVEDLEFQRVFMDSEDQFDWEHFVDTIDRLKEKAVHCAALAETSPASEHD